MKAKVAPGKARPPRASTHGGKVAKAPPPDRALARAIERWFVAHARPMPWRPASLSAPRDAWASLVSEVMLQQTQASRVAARFPPFLEEFPTPAALALASEDQALAAWSGMGYYRRARLLRACAKAIVDRHGGAVPSTIDELRDLPGIGAYTAGAIASIVFGARQATVDANIARVILRIEGKEIPIASTEARALTWERARSIMQACANPALLNEGLMELGAVVCTPRRPRCGVCPLTKQCKAFARGAQERIPARRTSAPKATLHHAVALVRINGRTLVHRRATEASAHGALWAGMWQPPTFERTDRAARREEVAEWLGVRSVSLVDRFERSLTHRRIAFTVWEAPRPRVIPEGWAFKTARQLRSLGLASPHAAILLRDDREASRPARKMALHSPPR